MVKTMTNDEKRFADHYKNSSNAASAYRLIYGASRYASKKGNALIKHPEIADYINKREPNPELMPYNERLKHLHDAFELLTVDPARNASELATINTQIQNMTKIIVTDQYDRLSDVELMDKVNDILNT